MAIKQGWTVDDLEVLPQPLDDTRYEIIDGELYVTTQPSVWHQMTCHNVSFELGAWSSQSGAGQVVPAPGVIFAEHEAVAPDVVWVSAKRLPLILGDDGKFHAAPDLVVEVLSPGATNEKRDRQTKLGVYSRRGVQEYWLVDWQQRTLQVYRHVSGALELIATLYEQDTLESPLLPGFSCPVHRLFAGLS
jgi:Uma2 family endonuclease